MPTDTPDLYDIASDAVARGIPLQSAERSRWRAWRDTRRTTDERGTYRGRTDLGESDLDRPLFDQSGHHYNHHESE